MKEIHHNQPRACISFQFRVVDHQQTSGWIFWKRKCTIVIYFEKNNLYVCLLNMPNTVTVLWAHVIHHAATKLYCSSNYLVFDNKNEKQNYSLLQCWTISHFLGWPNMRQFRWHNLSMAYLLCNCCKICEYKKLLSFHGQNRWHHYVHTSCSN